MQPLRLQRSRQRKNICPNDLETVYVGRPSLFGNPYKQNEVMELGFDTIIVLDRIDAVKWYEVYIRSMVKNHKINLKRLEGKNLSCWCKLCEKYKNGKPLNELCNDCSACHVDVIGNILNNS